MQKTQDVYFTPLRMVAWIVAVLLLLLSFLGADRRPQPVYVDAQFVLRMTAEQGV